MSTATAVGAFTKVIHPGAVDVGTKIPAEVFCRIEWDGERLSISGVEGPLPSGNARGSAGRIEMGYAHRDPADDDARYSSPSRLVRYAGGWDEDRWFSFLDVWHRWHLNDMSAECEHQRALGWKYDTHKGQNCPTCGYEIGTEWKREDVPADVLDFLRGLPIASSTPAWV